MVDKHRERDRQRERERERAKQVSHRNMSGVCNIPHSGLKNINSNLSTILTSPALAHSTCHTWCWSLSCLLLCVSAESNGSQYYKFILISLEVCPTRADSQ